MYNWKHPNTRPTHGVVWCGEQKLDKVAGGLQEFQPAAGLDWPGLACLRASESGRHPNRWLAGWLHVNNTKPER